MRLVNVPAIACGRANYFATFSAGAMISRTCTAGGFLPFASLDLRTRVEHCHPFHPTDNKCCLEGCRRFHRCERSRQHACQRRDGDDAVRRDGQRGAAAGCEAGVVALKTRSVAAARPSPIARRGPLAARPGMSADRLQILLDLRFDARGQYRPGRRGAGRGARRRRRPSPARPFRRSGGGCSGPPLRRRPAAQRVRHGEPSAQPDDRCRYPALAAAPDAGRGRACALRAVRGGPAPSRPPLEPRPAGGTPPRRGRCRRRCRPRGARRALAGHRLVTGGSGIALGLPGNFRASGLLADSPMPLPQVPGPAVVLCGSCSNASRGRSRPISKPPPGWRSIRPI